MTNTTQCPNCSSIFAITDEQYRASKGNVRCGTCRQKFNVVFLPDNDGLVLDTDVLSGNSPGKLGASQKVDSDLLSILSNHADKQATKNEEQEQPSVSAHQSDLGDDINSELSVGFEYSHSSTHSIPTFAIESLSESELSSNDTTLSATISRSTIEQRSRTLTLSDENAHAGELIDQVDSLIDSKLLNTAVDGSDQNTTPSEPFSLKPSWQSQFKQALSLFSGVMIALILLSILTYQLWLKQSLPEYFDQPVAFAQKLLAPLASLVADQGGFDLPVRQDLNNLQLLSAKTEAHPTRASTILLRISFLNRAAIDQPLPWLELSLTDEDGRLVSRRSFSPNDYLYNNATENLISANELKKVTIELLSFPKQAYGYELKMVGK